MLKNTIIHTEQKTTASSYPTHLVMIATIIFIIAALLPIQAISAEKSAASEEVQLTRSITTSRILLEKLMMNYHLSTAQQANPKYQSKARLAAEQIATELQKLSHSLKNADLDTESKKIVESWKEFQSVLKTNLDQLEKSGYAELQVVDNMVARARLFDNTLQFAYNRAKGNTTINTNAEAARSLSRLLQHIANKYAERAASVTGTAARAQSGEAAIDELAVQFIQQLNTLKRSEKNSAEVNEKLREVELKWKYIEKSLQNYTENSISFLVTRYSLDMVDTLLNVASIYDRS